MKNLADADDIQIVKLLRSVLSDSMLPAYAGAFVGWNSQEIALVAPYYKGTASLPIKLGEKILWRFRLPSIRLIDSAQSGIRSTEDAEQLIDWLRTSYPRLVIVFSDVMTDTPLYTAVSKAQAIGFHIINNKPTPHHFHQFKGSYNDFFQKKSSKYKNQLRKHEKTFAAKFGSDYRIKEYRSRESVSEFLNAANFINKKTYQYKLFGESVDESPESMKFYSDLAHGGVFRSFVLWHKARPICFIVGAQSRSGIFYHRITGFDPEMRKFAPGINCNILMLRKLYESDRPTMLDFGIGDGDYKRLFANLSKQAASPILVPRTFNNQFPVYLHKLSVKSNEVAAYVLDRVGVKETIKRMVRLSS